MTQKVGFQRGSVAAWANAWHGTRDRDQSASRADGDKGVTITPLHAIDLGPEIEGTQGRQFRMRLVTFAPGGVFGLHSHKDPPRPGFFYLLDGTLISHMSGVAKEYRPGDSWSENKETTHHWVENKGTIPAVGIAVDIFKQQ